MREFVPVGVRQLRELALSVVRNDQVAKLTDPAEAIFTDLRLSACVTVPASEPLDATLRMMQMAGVRMAFVIDIGGEVSGFVTAADLGGERPLQAAGSRGVSHRDLNVADVMTPVSDWATMDVDAMGHALVGDIVETFRAIGQRYLIVVETPSGAVTATRPAVRGLFSASRAERVLGRTIDGEVRSRSFSELHAALSHR